jgi:CotH kinase protein
MNMKRYTLFLLTFILVSVCSAQAPVRQLFDTKTIGEIRVNLSGPAKWWESLDSMRIYGKNSVIGDINIDGQAYKAAGVRFRGNNSYQFGLKRNPFQITLNYQGAEQNHQGHTSIKLSHALRDPSMVREVLFLETAAKYMPAPKAAYTRLYVNNEYIGVFVLIESIDAKFLTEHYGLNQLASVYKAGVDHPSKTPIKGCLESISGSLEYEANAECLGRNFEIESKGSTFGPLHELTQVLSTDMKKLPSILDIDETLWMLALNNVMVNLNSYSGKSANNYYLYQDIHGRFRPIIWDLNLAFGSYKNIGTGSDLDLKDLQRLEPMLHASNVYKPLISKLLADPLNKKIYLAHMRQILDDHFLNGAYERRAKELQGLIVVPYSEDMNKPYALDQFQSSLTSTIGKKTKIPGIVELMSKRAKFLKNHPELSALPSITSDIQFASREKYNNEQMKAFQISLKADKYPKRAILHYRFDARDSFKSLTLSEGAQVANHGSGVRAFEGLVEAPADQATMEYFIMIENSGTVSFSPANYTQKKYVVTTAEINK